MMRMALTAALLARGDSNVIAASRSATTSPALADLANTYPQALTRLAVDITVTADLERLASHCDTLPQPLQQVINCAGVLEDKTGQIKAEKRLADVSADGLMDSFRLNAFAPLLLAQALLPILRREHDSVFASLSARVGSIADNRLGGWYSYRAAKAAQNQLLRTLALEMRRSAPKTRLILLHPGTTDTPLSEPFQQRLPAGQLHSAEFTASTLLTILANTTLEDHGRFLDWRGEDIPW